MAETTKIQWASATFNPWRGCQRVSPGCQHCYAETMSGRNPKVLGAWGPNGTRVMAAESYWKEPVKWDRKAQKAGERARVFCASLADVFEDWQGPMSAPDGDELRKCARCSWSGTLPVILAATSLAKNVMDCPACGEPTVPYAMGDVRRRLLDLICRTPNLDWLVLTKRPGNALRMMVEAGLYAVENHDLPCPQPNLWIGTSVERQQEADERIPLLLKVPAAVRFLSVEPMLGPVHLFPTWLASTLPCPDGIDGCEVLHLGPPPPVSWVIIGCESGPRRRPMQAEWARSLVEQCRNAGVACFVKQMEIAGKVSGDMEAFPDDLRVRQFPQPTAGE